FVADSVEFAGTATADLLTVLELHRRASAKVLAGEPAADAAREATERDAELDLEYVSENLAPALARAAEGLSRIAVIVRSMKEFAHPDAPDMAPLDLNRAIESTLVIARNEYKYVADVETHFGELPPVVCRAGDVNQAVLNIVVNAAHAIGDVVKPPARGRI